MFSRVGADDEHEVAAAALHRRREEPRGLVEARRARPVRERRPPAGSRQLVRREHGCGPERRCRLEHPAAPVEKLGVALAALDQVARLGDVDRGTGLAHERGQILRMQSEITVERERQVRSRRA